MSSNWWQEAIVYQIYPKSFKDSNHDGIGDIKGIIDELDYIKNLGVNTLWLNPIFISPQIDNGYDISNYYAIDPIFGTEEELELFIKEAHKRELKVVFDFVLNHTSKQHPWFQEALKGPENIYRDYYIWEKPKEDNGLPNNWASFFGGSVWEMDDKSGEYYFHLFDKEMPDLNWENVEVRHAMLHIAKYWLSKGIDGYRLDAFIHMAKADLSLNVPDTPEGEFAIAEEYYANLPKVQEYLAEFIGELRKIKPDIFILGEAASATCELAKEYTDSNRNQCDTVVSFRYFPERVVEKNDKVPESLLTKEVDVSAFKETMAEWQEALAGERYPTLYWNNHDMPRLVSRFGNDDTYRDESAKMLATVMYLMRGLPVLLYGEEIGMKNLVSHDVSDFQAPEAVSYYKDMLAKGISSKEALARLSSVNKEASRGGMQWTEEANAGFSTVSPWSGVNEEQLYNVREQSQDKESILSYYQALLRLKKESLFSEGAFELLPTSDTSIVYRRFTEAKEALVIANMTGKNCSIEVDVSLKEYEIVLSNLTSNSDNLKELPPYGVIVLIKK